VLYFAFEESPSQFMRNMSSIGIHLETYVRKGLLNFHATRPTLHGLERHLATTIKLINKIEPAIVIIDPIDAFITGDNQTEVKTMLLRLVDFLKMKHITAFFASLTAAGRNMELTDVSISSLIDTWLLLRDIEIGGERNRGLYVLKSRGMAHSNQIREFRMSDKGIDLLDVYVGSAGVLTGSARLSQEAKDRAEQIAHQQEIRRRQFGIARKRMSLEAQIADLRAEFEAEESETMKIISIEKAKSDRIAMDKSKMAKSRKADISLKKTG